MQAETIDILIVINGAFAAVVWGLLFPLLSRLRYLPLTDLRNSTTRPISIVIPARNEERALGRLLQSLAEQSHPVDDIIVVDDFSEDNTVLIAQGHPVTVVRSLERPEGWIGKSWACWQGAQNAKNDILLFLDADVWLSKKAIRALIKCLEKNSGLVSVQPFHVTKRLYENLSAFFNLVVMIGLDAFTSRSRSGHPYGAYGPCMMCQKRDYFEVGGHAAIRSHIVDDVALAKRFLSHGFKVHCFAGKGSVFFQMYPDGLMSLVEGWTKNMATASAMSGSGIVMRLALWITGVMCAAAGPILASLSDVSTITIIPFFIYTAFAFQIRYELRRLGNFVPAVAVFFPVLAWAFILVYFFSVYRTLVLKKVHWKGRTISLS